MLILLWLFQIVFLESFYKYIKSNQIKNYADIITKNIQNPAIGDLLSGIPQQDDVNVKIYDPLINEYVEGPLYNSPKIPMNDDFYKYYKMAKENGGSMTQIEERGSFNVSQYYFGGYGFLEKISGSHNSENLIHASILNIPYQNGQTEECLLILTSVITPVSSTVETLRIQLIFITFILLTVAVILAIYISVKIAKPIVKINETARELARHNYGVHFEGKGYREIAELMNTLNFAAVELSKADKLRTELIANISHDLRTPLTMITGYGELMRDLPGENTPDNVQIIIDEATYLSRLVTDLLDLSKLQSGVVQIEKTRFCLTETIFDIFKRYAKLKEQDGYRIEFEHDRDAFVDGDELKLAQVIYNLINNAINYAGEDKTVTVRQIEKDGLVRIEIEDHGKGIEKENLEHIWERYYKADETHKSAVIGTGLGLSIVKNILDLHGAKYGVVSRPGEGSKFWFELERLTDGL